MTLLDAVSVRSSLREYQPAPLTPLQQAQLEKTVSQCNARAGLHIRLLCGRPEPFAAFKGGGRIRGAQNCLLFAGPAGDPNLEEKCGYWGERLVLKAQMMGLNTCWVALTFSKVKSAYVLGEGEKLACVIALGHGATQGVPRKSKTMDEVTKVDGPMPDWFKAGMEAVLLAPTAVNQQKFLFTLKDGKVSATPGHAFYVKMDLGIAKYHFEVGAGKENFQWA